jgi:hypothetical protein
LLKNHLFGLKCDLDHILFGTLSPQWGFYRLIFCVNADEEDAQDEL